MRSEFPTTFQHTFLYWYLNKHKLVPRQLCSDQTRSAARVKGSNAPADPAASSSVSIHPAQRYCTRPSVSQLCRAGSPIITPARKYWSTALVCMCYFKILRPVISMLMIVITKETVLFGYSGITGYRRRGCQPETRTHEDVQTRVDGWAIAFSLGWVKLRRWLLSAHTITL